MTVKLAFHGAASTVTGSCFLVTHARGTFLVDCGMFQGTKSIRELNYGPFPFRPKDVDFVLLTHAHIDHSGLLPKLVRGGFKGPIHCTEATLDLLHFMLPDSGHIQEMEVERLNRRNRQRGRPLVEPIYTRSDAENCLQRGETHAYGAWFGPQESVRVRFWNAGHILGSAIVEVEIDDPQDGRLRLLFSGDLGPDEKHFHPPPEGRPKADFIILESTYGNREREDVTLEQRREHLRREIVEALDAGGNLLIPAFAVERSQELLYTIMDLMRHGDIPRSYVFLDSPLAIRATEVFTRHSDKLEQGDDLERLFRDERLRFCLSTDESKAINKISSGAIILSASGMCEAGRIRHHLKHNLWRSNATVLFVGYQAPGTLGNIILNGARSVTIHGDEIAVRARIREIDGFSAHADQSELLGWVESCLPVDGGFFLTHGEPKAMTTLRSLIGGLGVQPEAVWMPALDSVFEVTSNGGVRKLPSLSRLPEEMAVREEDWHNAYARLQLNLSERLAKMPDDAAREDLLARLQSMLKT